VAFEVGGERLRNRLSAEVAQTVSLRSSVTRSFEATLRRVWEFPFRDGRYGEP
jgi:hypothetical protein